ncbi:hypothetical protein T01_16082 [Trichinella spiralis]|uniref:Uncharacterized protein n=1 Tax=Trichinella spiralis TaxID=6334 RepID=A0A0V1AH39_TRISP|nr:hypothetical protein T01_16082 [Trichinella spiralis]
MFRGFREFRRFRGFRDFRQFSGELSKSSSFSLSGRTYWPELEFEMDEVATSAFEFYLRQREEMLRPRRRM